MSIFNEHHSLHSLHLRKLDRLHSHYPVSNFLMIWLSQMIIIIFSLQSSLWCQHHHDNWGSPQKASFIAFITPSLNWMPALELSNSPTFQSQVISYDLPPNLTPLWVNTFDDKSHPTKLGQLSTSFGSESTHRMSCNILTRRFTSINQFIHGH